MNVRSVSLKCGEGQHSILTSTYFIFSSVRIKLGYDIVTKRQIHLLNEICNGAQVLFYVKMLLSMLDM